MSARREKSAAIIPRDSAWEETKAARRDLDHNDAVQESVSLQKQHQARWRSNVASSPDLNSVLRALIESKVPFVLTGAHAIGGWTGRPRSTLDIDILVKGGRNHARAVKVLKALYPDLETKDFAGVTGFFVPGEKDSLIDVTYPHRADIKETLANPIWTMDKVTGLRYRIPSLEAALANKYGAMITPNRRAPKRQLDAADFGWMVIHSTDEGRQSIDLAKLQDLGEKVWPGGGGVEILRLVEQVKAGKPINLDVLGRFTG